MRKLYWRFIRSCPLLLSWIIGLSAVACLAGVWSDDIKLSEEALEVDWVRVDSDIVALAAVKRITELANLLRGRKKIGQRRPNHAYEDT